MAEDRFEISFANINLRLDNSPFRKNQPFTQCLQALREMIVMQIIFVGYFRRNLVAVSLFTQVKNMRGTKLAFQANASFES